MDIKLNDAILPVAFIRHLSVTWTDRAGTTIPSMKSVGLWTFGELRAESFQRLDGAAVAIAPAISVKPKYMRL